MNLFTIENNKVQYHPEALLIHEFKTIWDRDKSKGKDTAVQEFAYIVFLTDYKSPYKSFSEEARKDRIIKDCITIKNWQPDEIIINACKKYIELQETPSMGLLRDAESAVEKIRNYFTSVNVSADKTGTVTKNLIANIKSLGDLIKGLQPLRDMVEKELSENKLKGQGNLGLRERPRNK
jgi:hypothetical protein